MRRVLGVTTAVLSIGLSVAACSDSTLVGSGTAAVSSAPTAPSTSASSTSTTTTSSTPVITPSSPTTTTTTASPTTATPTTTATTRPNATRDITDIHFRKPPGFVYGTTYRLNNPGERTFKARFLVPRGTRPGSVNPDVIALVLYRLPADVRVVTPQEQLARVRYYNRVSHATVQAGMHQGVIAGYPAVQQNAIEQSAQTTYRYAAWYIFGTHHVVLVSCQVHSKVARIASGCQSLLDSLRPS